MIPIRLFIALAIALTINGCRKQSPSVVPDTVMTTGRFEDGFTVELQRTELAAKMTFAREVNESWFGTRKSSEGHAWVVAGTGIELIPQKIDGQFSGCTFLLQNNEEPVLFVLLRARHADGKGLTNRDFMANGERQVIERKDGEVAGIQDVSHPTDDPAKMELHLQVEDGAGGWRDLLGPIMPNAEDGRAFAVVDAFPRRKPELRLRALHAGQPPVEFNVTNPGYKPSFTPLKPQTPPIVHDGGEFRIRCDGLRWEAGKNSQPSLAVRPHLDLLSLPPNSLRLPIQLFDETGNILNWKMGRYSGYDPLPNEKSVLLRCVLERDRALYPWREQEVTFLAEGRLAASAAEQKAELTPAGQSLGCTSITFDPPDASRPSLRLRQPHVLDFTVKGTCSQSQLTELQASHVFGYLAVFTNSDRSVGESQGGNYGHSSDASGSCSFDFHGEWAGPLKPGESFRIALIRQIKPATVEFALEVPEKPR